MGDFQNIVEAKLDWRELSDRGMLYQAKGTKVYVITDPDPKEPYLDADSEAEALAYASELNAEHRDNWARTRAAAVRWREILKDVEDDPEDDE
jgi:hypothetical protein